MVKDFNPLENEQVEFISGVYFSTFKITPYFACMAFYSVNVEITLLNNKNATEGNYRLVWGVCALF